VKGGGVRDVIQPLVDYNYWANRRVLRTMDALGAEAYARPLGAEFSFPTLQGMLVHIMSAELIWLGRWRGISPGEHERTEAYPSVAALKERWSRAEADFQNFVRGQDLGRVIEGRNSAGQVFHLPLWQMVQHVVNHGTHHRSEAATMLTRLGRGPEPLDLVVYYRSSGA
jgi:uncharacterized damage-inducible protein DinB